MSTHFTVKKRTFPITAGIADEGFEMLEQLAYLYLANNKVCHAFDLKNFSLYVSCRSVGGGGVIVLYFEFVDLVPAGSKGWQSPLVHSAQAYACNHFQYVTASCLLQIFLLTLLDAKQAARPAAGRDGQICLCL